MRKLIVLWCVLFHLAHAYRLFEEIPAESTTQVKVNPTTNTATIVTNEIPEYLEVDPQTFMVLEFNLTEAIGVSSLEIWLAPFPLDHDTTLSFFTCPQLPTENANAQQLNCTYLLTFNALEVNEQFKEIYDSDSSSFPLLDFNGHFYLAFNSSSRTEWYTSTASWNLKPRVRFDYDTDIVIMVGIVIAIVLCCTSCYVAFCCGMIFRRKRKSKSSKEEPAKDRASKEIPKEVVAIEMKEPQPAETRSTVHGTQIKLTEIPENEITKGELLGSGHFALVFRGDWRGTSVALKQLKKEEIKEFQNELEVLGNLNHPNVLRLLGVWTDANNEKYIVTEFVSGGALHNYLAADPTQFSVMDLLSIAAQIVSGMVYLSQQGIIHRDLSARNVLIAKVEDSYSVKVSDFGLSRGTDSGNYYQSDKQKELPVKWTAPEAIQYRKFSIQSDCWSLGVTLWEVFECGKTPYYGMSNTEALQKILQGYRLSQPENCPQEIYELMLQCWSVDPKARPSFEAILKAIQQCITSLKEQSSNTAKLSDSSSDAELPSPRKRTASEHVYQRSPVTTHYNNTSESSYN